ncbi:MAG: thiamine diphosphokinase [Clostridiales bacterium]|nr:thiamine diphosphokinase [Clostridiales bacterium]
MDAVIVSGGDIQDDFALRFLEETSAAAGGRDKLLLVAADRGLEWLKRQNLAPDLVVGDFDSLSPEGLAYLETLRNMEIVRLKPEKDDSDTQSAALLAMDRGAREIAILGAMGRRLDHLLGNLGLLSLGEDRGVKIVLVDSRNYVALIPSGTILKKQEQFGRYVSFFPVGGKVTGLMLEGFKYRFRRGELTVSDSGLTVSNEIVEDTARVTYESGSLLMIMSRD